MKTELAAGTLVVLDDWLAPEDCADILNELRFCWWQPSQLAFLDGQGCPTTRLSIARSSRTTAECWMGQRIKGHLRRIERRLGRTLGIEPPALEPWQAVRYRRGERFDEHHDAGLFHASPHGERTISFVLYLTDNPGGGATVFPALGARIQPKAGRLLTWRNLLDNGQLDRRMIHAGLPARNTKTILTTWAHERQVRPTPRRLARYAEAQQGRPNHPRNH